MNSRRALTRTVVAVILAMLVILCACAGQMVPLEAIFYAVVYGGLGWYWFLARTLPAVEWHGPGLALGLVGVVLFAGVLHGILKRWLQPKAGSEAGRVASRWSWRRTAAVVFLPGLLFTAGIAVVGEFHEVVWSITMGDELFRIEGSMKHVVRRLESQNRLKNLALAAHNIASAQGDSLPAGGRFDADGRQLHGWMTDLLPAFGQAALYRKIRRDSPWRSPENRDFYTVLIPDYMNPHYVDEYRQRTADSYGLAHYAGNSWLFARPDGCSLDEISKSDGTSQTLLMGEVNANFRAWGDAANWRDPALGLDTSPEGFGSPFRNAVNFAFADGSVRSLGNSIDPTVLRALATPAGGEKIDPNGY